MEAPSVGATFEPRAGAPGLLAQSRLSQQDFLRVLVAQLRHQNPLEPQADTEFISQIAQFDQLASLASISEALGQISGLTRLGQASGLIGRFVAWDGEAGPQAGLVDAVVVEEGAAFLRVGETLVPVEAVRGVRADSAA